MEMTLPAGSHCQASQCTTLPYEGAFASLVPPTHWYQPQVAAIYIAVPGAALP
jgi:hypothetical protein